MTLGVRIAQTPVPDIQSLPVIGPGVMITVNSQHPDTPDLSSPVIPERLREVHLHPRAGLGHKVVNCQLPDRLEPEGNTHYILTFLSSTDLMEVMGELRLPMVALRLSG